MDLLLVRIIDLSKDKVNMSNIRLVDFKFVISILCQPQKSLQSRWRVLDQRKQINSVYAFSISKLQKGNFI